MICRATCATVEETPIWVVDLGDAYFVAQVTIVAGADLADFVVGVIDDLPDLESHLLPEHTICGHYDGAVSEGASVDVTCNTNAHGRYLMVYIELELAQIDFGGFTFGLCEVNVYGDPFGKLYLFWYFILTEYIGVL